MQIKKVTITAIIFLLFLIIPVSAQQNDRYFLFTVNKTNSTIRNIQTQVIGGQLKLVKNEHKKGNYELALYSFDNKEIKKVRFNFNFQNANIKIAYYNNVEKVKIFQNNKEIYFENIGYLANVCGDGICQAHESREICKEDCPSGEVDDYCDGEKDKICDLDCIDKQLDSDCISNKKEVSKNLIIIGIILSSFIFLSIGIIYINKKNQQIN